MKNALILYVIVLLALVLLAAIIGGYIAGCVLLPTPWAEIWAVGVAVLGFAAAVTAALCADTGGW
jgi:hypothetical protein